MLNAMLWCGLLQCTVLYLWWNIQNRRHTEIKSSYRGNRWNSRDTEPKAWISLEFLTTCAGCSGAIELWPLMSAYLHLTIAVAVVCRCSIFCSVRYNRSAYKWTKNERMNSRSDEGEATQIKEGIERNKRRSGQRYRVAEEQKHTWRHMWRETDRQTKNRLTE